MLTFGNRERIAAQRVVAALSTVKTAVTLAAVAKAAYTGCSASASPMPVSFRSWTAPPETTPPQPDIASALDQQRIAQWTPPALTGLIIILNAAQGQQQHPSPVAQGVLQRLNPAA
jgi:hypothetical protein